jgi:pimeloyl-ACP methyl ester carboxylesterase
VRTILGTLLTDDDQQAIDTPAILAGVDVPVTVVWGSNDRILPKPEGVEEVEAGHMGREPGRAGAEGTALTRTAALESAGREHDHRLGAYTAICGR